MLLGMKEPLFGGLLGHQTCATIISGHFIEPIIFLMRNNLNNFPRIQK